MKVFWLRLYPFDPATGLEVEYLFTSRNHKQATTIVPGKTYLPMLENFPKLEISVFEGDFSGKAEVKCDNLTIAVNNKIVQWPNLVWDGARAELFKGYDTDTSFTTVKQIFSGIVDKAPEFSGTSANISLTDYSGNLEKDFLTLTYLGTGGVEGPIALKGTLKPLALGYPKNVEPILIDAANVVFQYSAYAETIGVQSLWENGLSFGAKTATVAYQGSIAATYAALVAQALTVGQWADAPSIGMFRLGGETSGVIAADVKGIRKGSGGILIANIADCLDYLFQSAGEARTVPANLTAFQAATGNMTISDYFTEQETISDVVERYLTSVGGYYFYGTTGSVYFNVIRMMAPTTVLSSAGDLKPVVEDVNILPVSAPYKELRMGVDKNFRVQNVSEISDALLVLIDQASAAAKNAQDAANQASDDVDTITTTMNRIGADNILSRVEKQTAKTDYADLQNEQTDILSRATGYAITTTKTNYNNALAALDTYLATLNPAWNDTTQDTTITRSTWVLKWRNVYYARAMLLNEIAANALFAQQAASVVNQGPWATLQDDPATYKNPILALADDGTVTQSEKTFVRQTNADLQARYQPLADRLVALKLNATKATLDLARLRWSQYLTSFSPTITENGDTDIHDPIWDEKSFTGYILTNSAPAPVAQTSNEWFTLTDNSNTLSQNYRRQLNPWTFGASRWGAGVPIKKDTTPAATRFPALQVQSAGGAAGNKNAIVSLDTYTGAVVEVSAGIADEFAALDCGDYWFLCATMTANADDTQVNAYVIPAYGANINQTSSAPATMGSIIAQPIVASRGSLYRLGKHMMAGRLGDYVKQLAAAHAAVSQVDSQLSNYPDGPKTAGVTYDSTDTTLQDADDLNYFLRGGTDGVAITSGVTMSYKVVSGTLNGFTSASGSQAMTVTNGVGNVPVNSMVGETVTIKVTLVQGLLSFIFTTVITKTLAPAPVTTGTGGTGAVGASQTSGFTIMGAGTWGTPQVISNVLTLNSSSATVNVKIYLLPRYASNGTSGPCNARYTVQRLVSGTWVTQGSAFLDSNPDAYSEFDEELNRNFVVSGTVNGTLTLTGQPTGVANQFRVLCQITTNVPSVGTFSHIVPQNGGVFLS
jgi:hypothetical protein